MRVLRKVARQFDAYTYWGALIPTACMDGTWQPSNSNHPRKYSWNRASAKHSTDGAAPHPGCVFSLPAVDLGTLPVISWLQVSL